MTAVVHFDHDLAALGDRTCHDEDMAARGRGVHCIRQEIEDHLLELAPVPVDAGKLACGVHLEIEVGRGHTRADQIDGLAHEPSDVDGSSIAR